MASPVSGHSITVMKNEIESILRDQKTYLAGAFNVKSLGLFGSAARGEATRGSDIDLLVEFREPPGLLRFLELEDYLSRLLKARVDLVEKQALKPVIGRHILREVVLI